MKKILVIMSAVSMLFCAASAQSNSVWKKQTRLITSATDNTSAAKIGKRGTITVGGNINCMELEYDDVKSDTRIGGGGNFELAFNVVRSRTRNLGMDVVVPISYNYMKTRFSDYDASVKYQRTELPVVLRPYFRYAVSKDLLITPFIQGGVGAMILNYKGSIAGAGADVNEGTFMYTFGGGVEFQLYKYVALTPKISYTGIAGESDEWRNNVDLERDLKFSLEAAFQLTRGWAFVAEYSYMMGNDATLTLPVLGRLDRDCAAHVVQLGFRYGF